MCGHFCVMFHSSFTAWRHLWHASVHRTRTFQPQLTSGRGEIMASHRCASMDCRCQPSGACTAPGGPFCGQHCACPGHGRRTQRGGTNRGAPSWTARRLAATRYETAHVIGEAVDYLWCHENDWCRRFEARSPTGVRRYLVSAGIVRLGWDFLDPADSRMAALVWASVAETLGPTRTERYLDGVRHTVPSARVQLLAPLIARKWRRRDHNQSEFWWRARERAERISERSPRRYDAAHPPDVDGAEELRARGIRVAAPSSDHELRRSGGGSVRNTCSAFCFRCTARLARAAGSWRAAQECHSCVYTCSDLGCLHASGFSLIASPRDIMLLPSMPTSHDVCCCVFMIWSPHVPNLPNHASPQRFRFHGPRCAYKPW